jgi:hypothetical protein
LQQPPWATLVRTNANAPVGMLLAVALMIVGAALMAAAVSHPRQ